MSNFIPEEEEVVNTETTADAYIEEIQKLKANTVDISEYNKLKDENKKLITALANGEVVSAAASETNSVENINNLRKKLFSSDNSLSNLEYCTNLVQLRDSIMDAGGNDIFLPMGHEVRITDEDVECANRVGNVLKECIEYAQGDTNIFTDELQRRMIDSAPPRRK